MSIYTDTLDMMIVSINEELDTAFFSMILAIESWIAALNHAEQTGDEADFEIADGLREVYEAELRIHDKVMTKLSTHVMKRMREEIAALVAATTADAPLDIW